MVANAADSMKPMLSKENLTPVYSVINEQLTAMRKVTDESFFILCG